MTRIAPVAAALFVLGCGSGLGPIPAPPGGAVAVAPSMALEFQQRAENFYGQLVKRRFNALETFNDRYLREHFRDVDRFYDYYASLATALQEAHFSKSRPKFVGVEEFIFETPTTVRVQIRYEGQDNRPLRGAFNVDLVLRDTWERDGQEWWVVPGNL